MPSPAESLAAAGWTPLPGDLWQPPESTRRHTLAVAALLLDPVALSARRRTYFEAKARGRPRTQTGEK